MNETQNRIKLQTEQQKSLATDSTSNTGRIKPSLSQPSEPLSIPQTVLNLSPDLTQQAQSSS